MIDIQIAVADIRNDLYERNMLPPGADVVLIAGSCALIEKTSGARYAYRAVNIHTYEATRLTYRTRRIEPPQYHQTVSKLLALPLNYGDEPVSARERARALLTRIFVEILPQHGFLFRREQLKLSLAMLDGLWDKKLSLCEAEVGTGKTHAYIMAVVVWDLFSNLPTPIILSTSTIALQRAVVEEYIPQISNILLQHRIISRPLTFVVRKGKSHYVCDARLRTYFSSIRNLGDPKDADLIDLLADLMCAGSGGIDLSEYPLTRYVKDRICVAGRCAPSCPQFDGCRYRAYTRQCMHGRYDFQITNHNYVFANLLNGKDGKKELLPDYKLIIFDEAHKLLDAARQMYGREIARTEISELLASIQTQRISDRQGRQLVAQWGERLEKSNSQMFDALCAAAGRDDEQARFRALLDGGVRRAANKVIDGLTCLPVLCRKYGDGRMRARNHALNISCADLIQRLHHLLRGDDLIYWIEGRAPGERFCALPKQLNEQLYEDMWRGGIPYVLTSGTLSVGGCFDLISRNLGIDGAEPERIATITTPSPFDYKSNALLYIPHSMPFPDIHDEGYVQAVANQILNLIHATDGHTLILFTSYWLMERVYGMTRERIERAGYPVFLMGRGRLDAIANYRRSGNGVLFASDSAGEGIDMAGDILSSLIIVKLPFATPDPITRYEQGLYPTLQSYLDAVTVPNMLIKLRQYAGRAIRTESDTAVISILDSRVCPGGKYRAAALDALFRTNIADDTYDVWAFIQNRKTAGYFADKMDGPLPDLQVSGQPAGE